MNESSYASIAKTNHFAGDFMPACHWKEPWSQCTWLSQHINYNSRYIKYQIILYNEEHTHISEEVVFSTRSLHFLDFARFSWGWWRSNWRRPTLARSRWCWCLLLHWSTNTACTWSIRSVTRISSPHGSSLHIHSTILLLTPAQYHIHKWKWKMWKTHWTIKPI